jgi:enoyl-CoA hydratase/carnithine racemase
MLLHCDLVYAAEGTTFQLPFVNLGVVPEAASSLLLPRLAGHQRASELLLYGDRFDARSALELGLINGIHPRENLDQVLAERVAALAAKPPQALLATKELLKGQAYRLQVAAKIEEERVEFERRLGSPEAREIMSAFLEKRPVDLSRLT